MDKNERSGKENKPKRLDSPFDDDILKLLGEYEAYPPLEDSDLTVRRAAKLWRVHGTTASKRLTKMVEDGEMEIVIKKGLRGAFPFVYVPVKNRTK